MFHQEPFCLVDRFAKVNPLPEYSRKGYIPSFRQVWANIVAGVVINKEGRLHG